jgi:arylsulfatase A-like enzyme
MPFRRNLVIVFAHGLRADALGDSQVWPLRTPSLEKLCERGVSLIASSACPADPGGMVTLLTGYHARQHGFVDQMRGPTACEGWPALLAEAGYHIGGVGVIGSALSWIDDAVNVAGVEQADSSICRYLSAMRAKGFQEAVSQQRRQRMRSGPFEPDRLLVEPDDDVDGFIAMKAREVLERMPADKPWALLVCFSGPGNDLPPPTLYDDVADRDELSRGFAPADFTRVDAMAELDYPRIMLQRLEPGKIARIRADYLGRVSLIDFGVGRLMSALEERPDAGRSWTVVASDHGQLLGEHGLIGHRSFLAPAVEVPVIIVPPAPGAASREDASEGLVSTVDVAATITALAGCDAPRAVVGRSLLPMLSGEALLPPLTGCLSEFGKRLMLETERYKVIFDTEARRAMGLYDLLNDAGEHDNLIDKPAGRNLIDSLRWRLGDVLLPLRARPI